MSAVADCVPIQKRVWIDLFAMRHWNEDDVESFKCMRDVLERCETVLVSWSSDLNLGPYATYSSVGETRCIMEIYLAEKSEKNVILKAGRAYVPEKRNGNNNNNKTSRPFRNFRAIHQSHITIDIRESLCGDTDRRDNVIKTLFEVAHVENADEVNRVVNIALKASLAYADWPELLSAACGRIEDLRLPPPSETDRSKPNGNVVRAFHAAASGGYLDLIQKLYDRGDFDIDVPNESGRTALLVAASYCQRGAVELLLKCGANVNATGSNGESALMWASSCGYLDVMKTLLDGGANVDMSDNDGFTALTGAAGGNQIKAMVKLSKRGATIDKTNNDGFTALMYASSLGHVASVRSISLEQLPAFKCLTQQQQQFSVNNNNYLSSTTTMNNNTTGTHTS